MSTTYQITSAQITDFIAFVLSNLEGYLAADLERLRKKSAPTYTDYDFCRSNLQESLSSTLNQFHGVSLLFSSYPEIREEILVAMDAAQQSYKLRFEEVQALKFSKKQSSADQSSPSSLELPVETLDDLTIEIPNNICGQCYTDKSDSYSCNRDDCFEKTIKHHSVQLPEVQTLTNNSGALALELLKDYLFKLGDYASFMPSEKWVNKVRSVVSDAVI